MKKNTYIIDFRSVEKEQLENVVHTLKWFQVWLDHSFEQT
jgi:hypothetical protein